MTKKIALVTGGIGGIGTEVCKRLSDQGHKVVAGHLAIEQGKADLWVDDLRSQGYDVHASSADLSEYEAAASMVEAICNEYGTIEILVNCAGITRDATLKNMQPENWLAVINTNLNSVFNVTKPVLNGMLETGFGRIVNISSVNGSKGQFGQTNYSSAKAGVHGFTMALAQETAYKGITVNTVSPGYVCTPMTDAIAKPIRDAIEAQIPMGRFANPDEVAHAVGFLTDEKSAYITGANLPVNGGLFISF